MIAGIASHAAVAPLGDLISCLDDDEPSLWCVEPYQDP